MHQGTVMKPLYRKISQLSGYSFSFQHECPPLFNTPVHFHPEYELILILDAQGQRFVGDSAREFSGRELVLIGPNLPHYWRCEGELQPQAEAYVIHFTQDFLGQKFFCLPELDRIRTLLQLSHRGISFLRQDIASVVDLIKQIPAATGFGRLLLIQQILHALSQLQAFDLLSSIGFVEFFDADSDDRINKVYEYAIYHFRDKISLGQVASVAGMSEIAFCRYFKSRTGKSFFTFLNEMRIGHSCKLLIEGKLNVTEVCHESGFSSLSHFNRRFKEVTNESPRNYRFAYSKTATAK